MRPNNYFLPSLLAGFSAGVLSSVPGIKSFSCCLLVPLCAFFAVYLFRKSTGSGNISFGQSAGIGILTGVFAALFGTAIETIMTLITRTNEFVETLPQTEIAIKNLNLGPIFDNTFEIMKQMGKEIRTTGFSLFYTLGILFSNLIVYSVFAFLGAITARLYFKRQSERI